MKSYDKFCGDIENIESMKSSVYTVWGVRCKHYTMDC